MRQTTDTRTKKLARTGLLFALCCALSAAESMLGGWVGLPPGVKPGLANVAVMYTLFFVGWRSAAALVVLKALFGALTRGLTAGFLSLCGGGLSFALLCLLLAVGHGRISWTMLSAAGALAHNVGQLGGMALQLGSGAVLYYLPVLVLAGIGCGVLSAVALRGVAAALQKPAAKAGGSTDAARTKELNDNRSQ